ncbi:MAG: TRAP transporter large permease [Treponema sp.]|nr:TRAP transporter large permease [Treponema sp.]
MIEILATIYLGSMIVAIILGMPIAFAILISAVFTGLFMGGGPANPQVIALQLMQGSDSVVLMAVPFFVLAGEFMNRGGLTKRIIAFSEIFVGNIRGGHGYIVILACLFFSSLVGSAVASTAALGGILIPMMAKAGYSRAKAAGLVAGSNLVSPIMPPSVPMIIYAVVAGQSIHYLFLGGIAPALYLTLFMGIAWFFVSRNDAIRTNRKRPTAKEAFKSFLGGFWALLLPVIILVGLRGGIFTATEAGVIAVVYAIIVGAVVYRELKPADFFKAFISGAKMSAVVMFLTATALVSAFYLTISRIPIGIIDALAPLVDNPMLLHLLLQIIIIVLGLVMDVVPTILIMTPIMLPLVVAAGIDLVYFGIVFTLANVTGLITPPVGPVLNVACATGNVKMEDVIPTALPYFFFQCVLVIVFVLFPETITAPLRLIAGYNALPMQNIIQVLFSN